MIVELNVVILPQLVVAEEIRGQTVVMVDVLRASTTIVWALNQGAGAIYPSAKISAARQLKVRLGPRAILGGERHGTRITGFDAGNSPLEYDRSRVRGVPVVLCTTNGTYTLHCCRTADQILVGAFANLSSICRCIEQCPRVTIVCAGTDRRVSDEDVLFAGAMVQRIISRHRDVQLDDSSRLAASRWRDIEQQIESGQVELWQVLADSRGGRNLMRLGYDGDIRFCSRVDACDTVPELDIRNWFLKPQDT